MSIIKLNISKLLLTFLLASLCYLVGINFFHNPVFVKTGCAPNPSCPACEVCVVWQFPEKINLFSLPLLILLYLFSCFIYVKAKKHNKVVLLNRIVCGLLILIFLGFMISKYLVAWQGKCRAFKTDAATNNHELRCPPLYNPFIWDKFQQDWEKTLRQK